MYVHKLGRMKPVDVSNKGRDKEKGRRKEGGERKTKGIKE